MKKITLKQAKELSEKKWQAIVDNDGEPLDYEQLLEVHPDLSEMRNACAMCQLHLEQRKALCYSCRYDTVCKEDYHYWSRTRDKASAQAVLDRIKEANKKR